MKSGEKPINPAPKSEVPLVRRLFKWVDRPVPEDSANDPEQARRARLIARFGLLGAFFGSIYASFYLLIGHVWGSLIIVICSSGFGITPYLMRRGRSIAPAGNFLVLVLNLGFTALCFVEGGLHGHSIAWLVSVPLCALLLVGEKAAKWWSGIALLAAGVVAAFDLAGVQLPVGYDPKWEAIVSTAGYLGLILFMFMLGWIFESGRAGAFAKMQTALQELAVSNERLVHLNNEKNEFLGIAAHDLKNPLTAIVGSAEMLNMTNDPTRLSKLSHVILSASTRMRDLITNLLDANAIEQGKFTSKLEPCEVRSLIEQCVENNQTHAVKKEIEIRVGLTDGLFVRADQAAAMQILDNLISNAVKYSPPKTTVHVHTLPEKENIVVSVRDEGPGISEADQKKLFQKYTRLTARPTGGESSTGLGLSIVKKLAEAMAGTVQCYSVLGGGATFTLRLPRTHETPAKGIEKLATPSREKTLVIEPPPRTASRN